MLTLIKQTVFFYTLVKYCKKKNRVTYHTETESFGMVSLEAGEEATSVAYKENRTIVKL